jgi:endonuclease YncB( thermonuclease family)
MSVLTPDYRYELDRVVRVIDGDTFEVVVGRDVGFRCRPTWQIRVRLEGVDTPEIRGGTPADQARAHQAREFAAAWLARGAAIVATNGRTTFERWLATITRGEESLADALVLAGLARRVG